VLPARARVRRRSEFAVAQRGDRAKGDGLVIHVGVAAPPAEAPKVGFIVGRGVGTAVVRNRVRRRLRHVAAARLAALPTRTLLVVRALPAAAGMSSADLARSLDRGLTRLGLGAAACSPPP